MAPAEETAAGEDFGSNADQQCALQEGCADGVPPLDEIFWEGFADEHGAVVGDVAVVTGRAMELQGQIPSGAHAQVLDHHIDGVFALEEALAAAMQAAQAGAFYGQDGVEFDEADYERVLELQERLEVGLDLLREHNGLYAAVLAQDFGNMVEQLALLAAAIVESCIDRSMDETGQKAQQRLEEFDLAWKKAAVSVAKIPADVAVDAAVGAAITAGTGALVGAGVMGALPAVALGLTIAFGASLLWGACTDPWKTDVGSLHDGVADLNGKLDIGADALAVDQVSAGMRTTAGSVGDMSMKLTVLMDAVEAGVAIDGMYDAYVAWEAFKVEHDRLQLFWEGATEMLGGFVRYAEMMRRGVSALAADMDRRDQAIKALEAVYGDRLYAI